MIRKKNGSPSNLLLLRRRLREYLLFSKLKTLIPPPLPSSSHPPQVEMREIINNGVVDEVELDPHHEYCLERDSSPSPSPSQSPDASTTTAQQKKAAAFNQQDDDDDDDDDEGCCIDVVFEEEEDASRPFKPSIKIRKMDDDSIHISTIVMKEVSLTSTLFGVLEEEKLDIVFENHYRTETKAAHNIQVRVQPGYDVDALETKLRTWAGCTT